MAFRQTPSQTVGPYFAYGLTPRQYGYDLGAVADSDLVDDTTEGEAIRIEGRVLDGAGAAVSDAMIEIWQADAQGRYSHLADPRGSNLGFKGFGRCGTGVDAERRYSFRTIKPGTVDDRQAPHITVVVFMRGLMTHAYTRLYFSDEAEANASDPLLQTVPATRRATLIGQRHDSSSGPVYRFDIHMQGDAETVFFDL